MLAKAENPEQVLAEIQQLDTTIGALQRDLSCLFARDGDERTAQLRKQVEAEIRQLQEQRASVEVRLTDEADRLKAEGEKALDLVFRSHGEYSDSLRAFTRVIRELQALHRPGFERAQLLLDEKAARRLQIIQGTAASPMLPLP
jgi:hypothetical protein